MRKLIKTFKRKFNKKGFTLVECIVALAVVGLISAAILPLTSSAINAFSASKSLRETANKASSKLAVEEGENKSMEVTVTLTGIRDGNKTKNLQSSEQFTFNSAEEDGEQSISVTFFDIKYKE